MAALHSEEKHKKAFSPILPSVGQRIELSQKIFIFLSSASKHYDI
jgi:hypothetical protein